MRKLIEATLICLDGVVDDASQWGQRYFDPAWWKSYTHALEAGGTSWSSTQLTIADFSVGALVPTAGRFGLPIERFVETRRWYEGLAALPGWRDAVAAGDAAAAAWFAKGRS